MMPKTIMIGDDLYSLLKKMKRDGESFGALIKRLIGRRRESLMDLAGTWPYSRSKTREAEESLRETWSTGWNQ
ncbi:MAG: antitoxin VapB family protein [Candidatus Thorarchaeota archaeon]